MDKFVRDKHGKDTTWIEFCEGYKRDCGECFGRNGGSEPPVCVMAVKELKDSKAAPRVGAVVGAKT